MNDQAKQIGALVRKTRKGMGLTQKELAQFTNLSHTGIGHIERGEKDVKFTTLLKLSKYLGLKFKIELED